MGTEAVLTPYDGTCDGQQIQIMELAPVPRLDWPQLHHHVRRGSALVGFVAVTSIFFGCGYPSTCAASPRTVAGYTRPIANARRPKNRPFPIGIDADVCH